MLLVYASDLAGFKEAHEACVDGDVELSDLLARLLSVVVERRLRRSLSRGYVERREALSRVRGRIDWLETKCGMLLRRGKVMCRYQDLTQNTPRNRLVRAALEKMARRVRNANLASDCRRMAGVLAAAGVATDMPTRTEMSRDRIARHDADDRLMVAASRLALDLVLPSEAGGDTYTTRLQREELLLRTIFDGLTHKRSSLAQWCQPTKCFARGLEVAVIEPCFEPHSMFGPLLLQHGEPCRVAAPAFGDFRLSPCAFVEKAEPPCCAHRRDVQRVATPNDTMIAQGEGVAEHQEYRLGRSPRALQTGRKPNASYLDRGIGWRDVAEGGPSLCAVARPRYHSEKWLMLKASDLLEMGAQRIL